MLRPRSHDLVLLLLIFISIVTSASAQMRTISLGLQTGITSTYTWDEGINVDPRYKARYDIKFAPIGVNYGIDYDGFGFLVSPGLFTVGQNYHVVNIVGGHEGTRKIDLTYLTAPVALKFHLIDLIFLKTSFVMGGSPSFLVNGKEEVSHNNSKLYFPAVVYPHLPDDYVIQYDGVLAPEQKNLSMLEKKDLKDLQIFGFIGILSDWYLSTAWKVSFDIRGNYSFMDNRSAAYLEKLKKYETIYDIPGKRRDIILNFNIGVARYIEYEKKDHQQKASRKSNTKKYSGPKYPWPGPRKSKPKS